MQFLWSPVLFALVLVPLLLGIYIWFQTRRRKYAARYSSLALVRPAMGKQSRWRRHIPPALFLGALAFMLIALARPVAIVRAPVQEGIVILAIDSSASMRSNDVQPSRFQAALNAAHTFIDTRPDGAQVGLVTFAADAAILQLPTDDKEDLDSALDQLYLQRGTAIGSGILASLDAIAISNQGTPAAKIGGTPAPVPTLAPVPAGDYIPAVVILLTDGANRNGPNPIDAAKTAAEKGVRVFTIGIGSKDGGGGGGNVGGGGGGFGGGGFGGGGRGFGGGFSSDLDEPTLQAIADTTGGKYFYAKDATDLNSIYNNLGLNIVLKTEKDELTVWFTLVAAILAIGALGLSVWWTSLN